MRRRKKLALAMLSIVISFCGSMASCEFLNFQDEQPDGSLDGPKTTLKEEFTITYDYGFHREGIVTPLLNGNSLCFDPEEYNISPLVAGDVVTISYTGEMLVQETYPGQIVINGGEIVNVTKTDALLLEVTLKADGLHFGEGEAFDGFSKLNGQLPQYTINRDGSFVETSSLTVETRLWATWATPFKEGVDGDVDLENADVAALYTYNPQFPISAAELFPELMQEDFVVEKVRFEQGFCGVAPGNKNTVKESGDDVDISNVLSYLTRLGFKEVPASQAEIDGGSFSELRLYTSSEEYILRENNGYFYVGDKYYQPSENLPKPENGDTMYHFVAYGNKNILYRFGEPHKEYRNIISEIYFKPTQEIPSYEKDFVLYSQDEMIQLYIQDETHFWLEIPSENACLYEIVGETTFAEIFADFTN